MNEQLLVTLNLAKRACELGDIERADRFYQQALDDAERLGNENADVMATVLYELQRFYASTGKTEEAKMVARRFRMVALHYLHRKDDEATH